MPSPLVDFSPSCPYSRGCFMDALHRLRTWWAAAGCGPCNAAFHEAALQPASSALPPQSPLTSSLWRRLYLYLRFSPHVSWRLTRRLADPVCKACPLPVCLYDLPPALPDPFVVWLVRQAAYKWPLPCQRSRPRSTAQILAYRAVAMARSPQHHASPPPALRTPRATTSRHPSTDLHLIKYGTTGRYLRKRKRPRP